MSRRHRSCSNPALLCAAAALIAGAATAQPSGGNTGPQLRAPSPSGSSASGLGTVQPSGNNLSLDSRWQVYAFERDGIRYVQVNNAAGQVLAAVGYIDQTFWVLPIGASADHVSVPGQTVASSAGTQRVVIYRSATFDVVALTSEGVVSWAIVPSAAE